jgi:hypothetical protein
MEQSFSRENFFSLKERDNAQVRQQLRLGTNTLSKQCCGSGSVIRDPVPLRPLDTGSSMGKKSRSGSVTNIPDHISESLETIFWDKILRFFDADPGIFSTLGPRWQKSGINIPDPQHWALRPGTARTAIT